MTMRALGRHVIVELYNCNIDLIEDVVYVEKAMVKAAQTSGATVINSTFHHFSPYGVSGVVVIQESHMSIHCWPEYCFASVDLFTCGDVVNPWKAYDVLKESLKAEHGSAVEMSRGQVNLLGKKHHLSHEKRDSSSHEQQEYSRTRDVWFTERNTDIALSLKHTGKKLFECQSAFQKVEIYDSMALGKILVLDGNITCAEKDEYVYHEMIAHVPAFVHPNPEKILIIGGGDGGTVRELVKHKMVKQIDLVEIDKTVIEATSEFMPEVSVALQHPKLNITIDDGVKYVKKNKHRKYDLIIVDSNDPVGPGTGLFTSEFYLDVYDLLDENGILITQSESPRFNEKVFQKIYHGYYDIFGRNNVHCYLIYLPSYPTGMWSFSFSSKGKIHPVDDLKMERLNDFFKTYQMKYYNSQVHIGAFSLPNFVLELLS